MTTSLVDIQWLVSPKGNEVIHSAGDLLAKQGIVAVTSRLRKEHSPERTHLVIEQVDLRRRAKEKFGAAERMFFTDVGLQQATGEVIADYKAERFAGNAHVFDLCCGIGGDLLSWAKRGPVIGVDRDEIAVMLAEANCRALGYSEVTLRCDDVTKTELPGDALVHIDPDRRPQGRRSTQLALHEPAEDVLERLMQSCAGGAIKLAPAAVVPPAWQQRCELEWIGHRGECKQLVVWIGSLVNVQNSRRATVLADGGPHSFTAQPCDADSSPVPIAERIAKYVFEPDSSVIAAGLTGELARKFDLAAIATGIAYLTSDQLIDDPAMTAFEVVEVLPLDVKKLKAAVRARAWGRLEVKKRGVDIDPAGLRHRVKCAGDDEGTLILTPHAGRNVAILARRKVGTAAH